MDVVRKFLVRHGFQNEDVVSEWSKGGGDEILSRV